MAGCSRSGRAGGRLGRRARHAGQGIVVRCGPHPPLGFRELGILSQIGELTGAAADRVRDAVASRSPDGRW